MDAKVARESGSGIVMTVKVDVGDLLVAAAGRTLDVVFRPSYPPEHWKESELEFVEIESPAGVSVKAGTWVDRGNGDRALRLTLADFLSLEKEGGSGIEPDAPRR